MELHEAISESRRDLEEEKKHIQRACGREREQMASLEGLGLNEVEAVEYVLMVSRDEEEARRRNSPFHISEEDGVFEGDFDGISHDNTFASPFLPATSPSFSAPSALRLSHCNSNIFHGRPSAGRPIPSTSNHNVQVSPCVSPEPAEAGASTSPTSYIDLTLAGPKTSRDNLDSTEGISPRRSVSGSPHSVRHGSAWSTPLRIASSIPSPRSSPAQAAVSQTAGV